jgi:hypothetical protein
MYPPRGAAYERLRHQPGLARTARSPRRTAAADTVQAAHPEVIIGDGGFGTLQARLPQPNGETVTIRYTLRELLDRLDELTAAHEDQPGRSAG